jgi:hypothetical protein
LAGSTATATHKQSKQSKAACTQGETKMKKVITTLKLLAAGVCTISMAGCATNSVTRSVLDDTYYYQGKVLRGEVMQQFIDMSKKNALSEGATQKSYVYPEQENTRQAKVRFRDGRRDHLTFALVPDQIEFDDIEKGAIVDFILQYGPRTNFATYQVTRILQLVCRAKDESCISRERLKGFSKVVDADPGDTSAKYGVTYNRRITPEDNAKYK